VGAGCGRALLLRAWAWAFISGRRRPPCQMTPGVSKSRVCTRRCPPSPPPEGRVDAQGVRSVRILGLFGGGGFFVGGGCRFWLCVGSGFALLGAFGSTLRTGGLVSVPGRVFERVSEFFLFTTSFATTFADGAVWGFDYPVVNAPVDCRLGLFSGCCFFLC